MPVYSDYEMVIGLEVHVELKTRTKIFCNCPTTFGAAPNTHVCPVCMGLPGSLPVLNKKVVEYAVKAGMATGCTIARYSKQDRKNYFYPDLPKAYQISQYDLPLCEHGHLDIETSLGSKRIGITRIHIEEDAGKLVHGESGTMIDCNRCGVPLIEIVSEPDIRSAEEAVAYLQKLRATILYTGISDCRMQEGSLRCDVNLSVHKPGTPFGTRTEMKNLNSFQYVQKAIEYEFKRQVDAIEAGEEIVQETRRFDEKTGKTFSMRKKEDANDYRYFPDPDLAPIELPESTLSSLQSEIPALPDQRKAQYIRDYLLTPYDAEMLTETPETAEYFEAAAAATPYKKQTASLILTEVFRLLALGGEDERHFSVSPAHLASLVTLTGDGAINSSTEKKVLSELWKEGDADPEKYIRAHDLFQIDDRDLLAKLVDETIAGNPKSIADFKKGKTNALKSLVGQIMGKTSGRANPVIVQELIDERIKAL